MRTPATLLCLGLLLPRLAAGQGLENRYFDSDGVRIHYVDAGAGEPVLLIHGFSVNLAANWVGTGMVAALVDAGYRVVAYDDRGHGLSDKPHDPAAYGEPEIADAVRLLDHVGIDRAHVVGYSRGGVLALQLRAQHPDRVRTLVIGDSPGLARRVRLLEVAGMADSVAAGSAGPMMRALAPPGEPPPAADSLRAAFRDVWRANDFAALAAVLRAPPFQPIDLESLAGDSIPTLVVVGQRDPVKPLALRLARDLGGADTVIIPGATHLSAVADPAFARAVLDFLARNSAAAGTPPRGHERRPRSP